MPNVRDDDDIEVDDFDLPSMRLQIQKLSVGKSFARAARFDGDYVNKGKLHNALRGLRLAIQPTVSRVQKTTGQRYTVEEGEMRTQSKDVVVAIIVTRLM